MASHDPVKIYTVRNSIQLSSVLIPSASFTVSHIQIICVMHDAGP
jgi:hypothetical protein